MIPLAPRLYALAVLLVVLAATFGIGYWEGYGHERAAWAADTAKREKAESLAIIARTAENSKLAAQQAATNDSITKAKDEELASVRARLAAAPRMREPAFCRGTPATAQAESTASSTTADPTAGLVPVETQRDFEALTLDVESALATGRACQAFITANGMTP